MKDAKTKISELEYALVTEVTGWTETKAKVLSIIFSKNFKSYLLSGTYHYFIETHYAYYKDQVQILIHRSRS